MTPDEQAEMWLKVGEGDTAAREQAIVFYYPIVKRIAGKMCRQLPAHVDPDDIISFGTLGLLRAVGNYKPNTGVYFETFAAASIRGVVLDELRAMDWAPRSLRKRQRDLDKAQQSLESALGRSPDDYELALELEWTPADVSKTRYQTEGSYWKSLDEPGDSSGRSKYEMVTDHDDTPEVSTRSSTVVEKTAKFIADLPAQERAVIVLYYYEGLRLAEVGKFLGIPESKASQVHSKAMLQVREHLVEMLAS